RRHAVSALFGGRGIDDALDLGDLVGGETALLRVLAHHLLARGEVHAVDLVAGDVALHPLDLRPQTLEHVARFLRDCLQLVGAELAGAGDLALDEVFGHGPSRVMYRAPRRPARGSYTGPASVFGSRRRRTSARMRSLSPRRGRLCIRMTHGICI